MVRSKLGCMHELPVQPDYRVNPGNYSLKSNPERHEESPLAVANGNWFTERKVNASTH